MNDQKQALDLEAVKQRREAAFEWVFAMCKGETRFKMSIPYQETDTDALLCAALKDSENLAAEVGKLRESVASLLALIDELEPGGFPEGHWPHEAVTNARATLEAEAEGSNK